MSSDCDWTARDVSLADGRLCFEVVYKGKSFLRPRLSVYGAYNIRNAMGAIAVLNHEGVAPDIIRSALEAFQGVLRRLQLRAEVGGIRIYEDFAHHPTAVRETLQAARETFFPKRLWAIYEPRSATSRRNIFQREINEALALADCIVLPALYRPERIPEEERLDVKRLVEELRGANRAAWNLETVEDIIRHVCSEARSGDVVVILSNGGFGGIYNKLPAALRNQVNA